MNGEYFLDIDFAQKQKTGHAIAGDTFLSRKDKEGNRVLMILSDGLGSGIKAAVLSTLTSSMAANFTLNYHDIEKTAHLIMATLPVCKVRQISYSTFTIVDINADGYTRMIEYDNPPALLIRDTKQQAVEKKRIVVESKNKPTNEIFYSEFQLQVEDRIVLVSDGVTQSGIGTPRYPLGWGAKQLEAFILTVVKNKPIISSRDLSLSVVEQARENDAYTVKDDTTCCVAYYRTPRRCLVLSGPPFHPEQDKEMAAQFLAFQGKKVICGGTTSQIIARETNQTIEVDMTHLTPGVPPMAIMKGADLVTEGIITIGKAASLLETADPLSGSLNNPAHLLVAQLLGSDWIEFLVGTRINEAHQDPTIPVELEIRRNIIRRVANILQDKYLKKVSIRFM